MRVSSYMRDSVAFGALRTIQAAGGRQVTYTSRANTGVSIWALPGYESRSGAESQNMGLDATVRSFRVPSGQPGLRAAVKQTVLATNVATLDTRAAHGFVAGQLIRVSMLDSTEYNGRYVITSVPTETQITYALTDDDIDRTSERGDIEAIIEVGDTITHESDVWEIRVIESDLLRSMYMLGCEHMQVRHLGTV